MIHFNITLLTGKVFVTIARERTQRVLTNSVNAWILVALIDINITVTASKTRSTVARIRAISVDTCGAF